MDVPPSSNGSAAPPVSASSNQGPGGNNNNNNTSAAPAGAAAAAAAAAGAAAASANKPAVGVTAQTLVLPRHSPDEPSRITVAYRNGFVMEYEFPDVSIPVAVLRKAPAVDVIRRQWLVQRLEVVMGEMDEQLPRAAFQNRFVVVVVFFLFLAFLGLV